LLNLIYKIRNNLAINTNPNKEKYWLYLIVFPVGHGAVDWGGGALWLLAPAMALSMGLSHFQVGLLFAARQISAGISQLPAGIIGDNLKRRGNFLLVTFWWVSVTQLAASSSTNYWIVVIFLTLASSGAAAWHPVAMGSMVQYMPNRKGFVLAIHMLGGNIAEIAAPLLAGILLIFLDWNRVLQINTLPTVILGLIFLRLAPMVKAPPYQSGIGLNIKDLTRSVIKPGSLTILMMIMLHNMSLVAFMSMTPLYFQEVRGLSSGLTGLGFSLFLLGGAVTAPFAGHISDKIGRKAISIWGLIGGGICAWLITLTTSNITIFPLLIITGMLMLSVRSVIIAMALEKIGHRESTVLGLISSIGEGFAALGAVFAGILGDMALAYSLILAAILSIIAGLTLLPLNQNSTKDDN
jgi:MFS family permease